MGLHINVLLFLSETGGSDISLAPQNMSLCKTPMCNHFLTCIIHLKGTSSYPQTFRPRQLKIRHSEGISRAVAKTLFFCMLQFNLTITIGRAFLLLTTWEQRQLSVVNYYFPTRFQLLYIYSAKCQSPDWVTAPPTALTPSALPQSTDNWHPSLSRSCLM